MKKIIYLLMILLLIITLSACTPTIKTEDGSISIKDGELEITDEDGGKVSLKEDDDGNVEIETEDGKTSFVTDPKELPEDYPEDVVPIMDGCIITSTIKSEDNGNTIYQVTFESKKLPKEVFDFYKEILEDGENTSFIESGDEGYYGNALKNSWNVGFTVNKVDYEDDNNTVGTLMINKEVVE